LEPTQMVSFKTLPSLITRYLLKTISRNANISHIASGFIYCSPSQQKVRVDEAYDSGLGSSLFDYTNITNAGVANRQLILHPAITSPPNLWQGYVSPAFPLIPRDFLVTNGAVFGGIVDDSYVGEVATVCSNNLLRARSFQDCTDGWFSLQWNIMFQGAIPAKILLDKNDVVQGYDYWGTELRTYAVTRFFNIILGKIDAKVFDFPSS
jgi:hypothetical protein